MMVIIIFFIKKDELTEFFLSFKELRFDEFYLHINVSDENNFSKDIMDNIDEKYRLTFLGIMHYIIKNIFTIDNMYYNFNIYTDGFSLDLIMRTYELRSSHFLVSEFDELNKYEFVLHYIWFFLSIYYNYDQVTYYILKTDKDKKMINHIFKNFFNIYYINSEDKYCLSIFDDKLVEEHKTLIKQYNIFIDNYVFDTKTIIINKN